MVIDGPNNLHTMCFIHYKKENRRCLTRFEFTRSKYHIEVTKLKCGEFRDIDKGEDILPQFE